MYKNASPTGPTRAVHGDGVGRRQRTSASFRTSTPIRGGSATALIKALCALTGLLVASLLGAIPVEGFAQSRAGQVESPAAARWESAAGIFTDIGAGLPGVSESSAQWGDYDNDGDLDLLLTEYSDTGPVSKHYRNDGSDLFKEVAAGALTGVEASSAQWGDYDNDGDLDILLTGVSASGRVSKIYRNDGSDTFPCRES